MTVNKKVKKRLDSAKEYTDKLFEKYSKLNVIRLDVSYKKPHSEDMSLEDIKGDIKHMLGNRRSKPSVFEHSVGHVIKTEYTKDKGVHGHIVMFFDGQRIQKSNHKAQQVGLYWEKEITKEKGSYHSCHRNTYKKNGIGMIDYTDKEKRENLDVAVGYLCKDEQTTDSIKGAKQTKSFTRGTIPKSKGNIGRPRG